MPENLFWQQVQGVLASELVRDEYEDKLYVPVYESPSHPQVSEIATFVDAQGGAQCLLLVGQYGVGKTSLLSHYHYTVLLPRNRHQRTWNWIYFDGNKYASKIHRSVELLTDSLRAVVALFLQDYLKEVSQSANDFALDVFEQDPSMAGEQILNHEAPAQRKMELARNYMGRSSGTHLDAMLNFLVRQTGANRTILVLDNLDPLDPKVQASAVKTLIMLAKSCGIKGIAAVRRGTESFLRYGDEKMIGQFFRTMVKSPSLIEVIRRRIEKAIQHPEVQGAKVGEGAVQFVVRDHPEFVNLLVRGLSSEGVQRIVNGLANESVREGLRMALSIYASPLLDWKRMIRQLSGTIPPNFWHDYIPNHIVVKSLVLRTAAIYDPGISWVGNIFGTLDSNTHIGPFLRLHVLKLLRLSADREFLRPDVASFLSGLLHVENSAVVSAIKWLADQEWMSVSAADEMSLTQRGRFIIDDFVYHREYLMCISTDVDMYASFQIKLISTPKNFTEQLNNLSLLLSYLALREEEMLKTLARTGLRNYVKAFGSEGIIPAMIKRIAANLDPLDPGPILSAARAKLEAAATLPAVINISEVIRKYA